MGIEIIPVNITCMEFNIWWLMKATCKESNFARDQLLGIDIYQLLWICHQGLVSSLNICFVLCHLLDLLSSCISLNNCLLHSEIEDGLLFVAIRILQSHEIFLGVQSICWTVLLVTRRSKMALIVASKVYTRYHPDRFKGLVSAPGDRRRLAKSNEDE